MMEVFSWRNLILWLSTALLLALLLFAPRGCTSTSDKGEISSAETLSVNIAADRPALSAGTGLEKKLKERYLGDIFSKQYAKQDWLLFVDHKCEVEADLSSLPKEEPASLSVAIALPGSIVSTNAHNKTDNTATWALALGKNYKMEVASRHIRWWLIAALALLLIISLSTRFIFKQKD